MNKNIKTYYFSNDKSQKGPELPDNTDYLKGFSIYSFSSPEANTINQQFKDKIERGETVYLVGFQAIIHNSGVALIAASKQSGINIIANYEEERFIGEKHFAGYPQKCVAELKQYLAAMGKRVDDIFGIFYGWDLIQLEKNFQKLKIDMIKTGIKANPFDDYLLLSVISKEAYDAVYDSSRKNFYVYSPLLAKTVTRLRDDLNATTTLPCVQMLHHENHAYFSYGVSPFYSANSNKVTMVACIDGNGDISSSSFYQASGDQLTLLKRLDFVDSLGNFYSLLSSFLGGWSALSAEGRYMGAAAWGNYNRLTNACYRQLRQFFYFGERGDVFANRAMMDNSYAELQKIVGTFIDIDDLWNPDAILNVNDIKHSSVSQQRVDKAAAVQMVFEDVLFHFIDYLITETHSDQLVLCGGTALNCVANMRLIEHFDNQYYQRTLGEDTRLNIWIAPIPSDQGVVVGAAYQFAMRNAVKPLGKLPTPFLCGHPPSSNSIRQALEASDSVDYNSVGNINDHHTREQLADFMAYVVSQNGVIGIFQGAAETGPRALGHRSLLSNPCNTETLAILNSRVKLRERIRPLAPMVTMDEAKKWFKLSQGAASNDYDAYDYMILTVEAKAEAKSIIPAVIHYDGTSRIQIVRERNNQLIFEYLQALKQYIGVGVSVNTSLNVGSPIVQTPEQALQIFKRAKGLDGLFMISAQGEAFITWAKPKVQAFESRIALLKESYCQSHPFAKRMFASSSELATPAEIEVIDG